MNPKWVRDIRDRCVNFDVPFFFKQWGGVRKKRQGRMLDGRTWDEMPSFEPPKGKLEKRLAAAARRTAAAPKDLRPRRLQPA